MFDSKKAEADIKRELFPHRTILRLPDVMRRTRLSRSTIYRMIRNGEFPNCRKIGLRATGWDSIEIDNWIAENFSEGEP